MLLTSNILITSDAAADTSVSAVLQTAPHKPAASGTPQLVINAQEVTSATWVLGDTVGDASWPTAGRPQHIGYSCLHKS